MSGAEESPESTPRSDTASPRDATAESSPWWTFGLVSAVAAAAAGTESVNAGFSAEEEAGEAATAASVNDAGKDGNGDGRTRVRFHPAATEGGKGPARRQREQEDTVANMGFVELVENLLLSHDSSNRRGYRSSSIGSIATEVSEADSDVDSVSRPMPEEEGGSEEGGWEWDAEEIASFASQIHEKMRQQLEQEAAFMDIALKSGFAVMKGALAIEDDTKMLIREGRLAGLGLTPLDDDTHTHLNRIDLSMLLTLTPDNYERWQHSLCSAAPQPVLSVRSTHRPSNTRRLLGTSGISDQLRSPLFKMHRELALLGSTSSEDSVSESESEHSRTSKNGKSSSSSSTKFYLYDSAAAAAAEECARQQPDKLGEVVLSARGATKATTAAAVVAAVPRPV
ncbi:uncharacterized protein LOC34622403 [Cyclospora cayetanensis]|uniref:Uncharacterized protein LOC34622403 n=1 Tax=Cyclospora cayetanensis TaxID=88456 RepID=A0A6P6RU01_9EIME|nr:uncharacterized protein LOC34622403 [Cyclospora cayetanensis]